MSWFDRLTHAFAADFGLTPFPLHDFDTSHEPSAPHLRVVDTSPACVCSPGCAGSAVGHPDQWPIDWNVIRSGLAELAALVKILEIKQ